jgi:hypothetical protein
MSQVGTWYQKYFASSDVGPFWMTATERELNRKERPSNWQENKKVPKPERPSKCLASKKCVSEGNKRQTASSLQKQRHTDWREELDEVVVLVRGSKEKPKGMLQILWERGFIDSAKKKEDYTVDGKQDAFGIAIHETSPLKHLMSLLTNCIEEEMLLQYHGRLLGVKVESAPKCHPEIAGEGMSMIGAVGRGY